MERLTKELHSSPLRVLYLIDSLASGGAQRQLITLLSALDHKIVKPTVAVYRPFWHFRPDLERIGVPILLLGNYGARDPRVTLRLARIMRIGRFDLVHSYLITPGLLARAVSMVSPETRTIISQRNTDLDQYGWQFILERLLANRGDAMITNAEAIKTQVEQLLPKWCGRIHVVSNGIRFKEMTEEIRSFAMDFRSQYVTADNQILVGVVARLSPQKDPLLLLDALKRLPDKILSRLRIVWIGSSRDNNLRTTVTDKIRHLDLSNSFFLLPEMRQIRIAYQSIDALVLPSRWEGFPNAVLEALAEGKPVIATEVGDVRAMVENGKSGWVVPPADPEALAGAIEEMVKIGHNSRKKMGKSGCDKVRKLYSSERLAEQTLAVYDKILV